MRLLICSAIAAALLIPGVANAQDNGGYRTFKAGERFSRAHDSDYRVLSYRHYRILNAPPPGYAWIRSGSNALLVRKSDDFIARVVPDVF